MANHEIAQWRQALVGSSVSTNLEGAVFTRQKTRFGLERNAVAGSDTCSVETTLYLGEAVTSKPVTPYGSSIGSYMLGGVLQETYPDRFVIKLPSIEEDQAARSRGEGHKIEILDPQFPEVGTEVEFDRQTLEQKPEVVNIRSFAVNYPSDQETQPGENEDVNLIGTGNESSSDTMTLSNPISNDIVLPSVCRMAEIHKVVFDILSSKKFQRDMNSQGTDDNTDML